MLFLTFKHEKYSVHRTIIFFTVRRLFKNNGYRDIKISTFCYKENRHYQIFNIIKYSEL